MKKHKVLITGANGFIASHLVEKLQESNSFEVFLTSRSSLKRRNFPPKNFIQADISSKEDISKILEGIEEIDTVVHLAGRTGLSNIKKKFQKINVDGTQNIVEIAQKLSCKNFIFISSPSVYLSSQNKKEIKEDDIPARFLTHYAESKFNAEQFLMLNNSLNFQKMIILRPGTVFGPGNLVLLNTIKNLIKKRTLLVLKKPEASTSVTGIQNMVYAILVSIKSNLKGNHVFNIANKEEVQMSGLFRRILERRKVPFKEVYLPFALLFYPLKVLSWVKSFLRIDDESVLHPYIACNLGRDKTLSIAKASKELGYEPSFTLESEFEVFLEWLDKRIDSNELS